MGNFSEAGKVNGTCGKMTHTRIMTFSVVGLDHLSDGIGVTVRCSSLRKYVSSPLSSLLP